MRWKGLLQDRKVLIAALEKELGERAAYGGAPSFRYFVGPYTVLREGELEAEDEQADYGLLLRLSQAGMIELNEEDLCAIVNLSQKEIILKENDCDETINAAFIAKGLSGREIVNLVISIASRQGLLNQAIGAPGTFHIDPEFARELRHVSPGTPAEFRNLLYRFRGDGVPIDDCAIIDNGVTTDNSARIADNVMKGIQLIGEELWLTGFPDRPECRILARHIISAARSSRWTWAKESPCVSDREAIRSWLNSLGLRGEKYRRVRAALLRRFGKEGENR